MASDNSTINWLLTPKFETGKNENEKLNVLKLDEPQACVKLIVGLLMVIVCEVPRKGKSNRVEKIIFHNFEENARVLKIKLVL